MKFLQSLLFCIKVYCVFANGARKIRRENLGVSPSLYAERMNNELQRLYSILLEKATHLTMKGDEDIYYNILDTLYDSAQRRYVK